MINEGMIWFDLPKFESVISHQSRCPRLLRDHLRRKVHDHKQMLLPLLLLSRQLFLPPLNYSELHQSLPHLHLQWHRVQCHQMLPCSLRITVCPLACRQIQFCFALFLSAFSLCIVHTRLQRFLGSRVYNSIW